VPVTWYGAFQLELTPLPKSPNGPPTTTNSRGSLETRMSQGPITINQPGDAHELTFSCHKRLPLLNSDHAKSVFLPSLDEARKKHRFDVWAYVVMPEHVHLLIHPRNPIYSIDIFRKTLRQTTAKLLLPSIRSENPALAEKLKALDTRHRFWLKGKGLDRNLSSTKAIHAAIAYLHANPSAVDCVRTSSTTLGRAPGTTPKWVRSSFRSIDARL